MLLKLYISPLGPRYVSWFPSFSVEVSHTSLIGERQIAAAARTSQLDAMVRFYELKYRKYFYL